MSRTEKLLNALIGGQNIEDYEPQSRIEILLKRICLSENCDDLEPKSRIEYLLKELSSCVGGSGSGEDMLQTMVDATNSCSSLFNKYSGTNVDFIKNLDTSNVIDMSGMFYSCSKIQTIPLINTSNVTNMNSMFMYCWFLEEIPQLDTNQVTNMSNMFMYCEELTTIPQLDTSQVTDMNAMFQGCEELTTIPQLDTSNVIDMSYMFYYCKKLTSIPQLNVSNVISMDGMFTSCSKLKSILMYGMKVNFSIYYSDEFEVSDLVTILSNCQVVSSSTTFTMGSTNLAKLNGVYVKPTGVELYEGITCNPCVICESTDEGAMLATDYFTAKGWTLA